MNKKLAVFLVALMALGIGLGSLVADESKSSSSVSAAVSVTFGPRDSQRLVKSIYAKSGTSTAEVQFWTRSGTKLAPTANPTNGATVISIVNTGNIITTNDTVAYVHANGTVDQTTVSANTATTVTLAAGITVAGATGDYLYELAQNGTILIANTAFNQDGPVMYATPTDSPLLVKNTGATNNYLLVTVGD